MEDENTSGLSTRTFSTIIILVVVAAVAMFVGLYVMGANKQSSTFNDGYESYYDPMYMDNMPTGLESDYASTGEYPEGEIMYGEDYTEFYPYEADGFYYESTGTMEGGVQFEDGFYPME